MTASVIYSNKLERLFEGLKQRLFPRGSSPFARRVVVVPSPAIRTWLQYRLADDTLGFGVAAGVEVLYLGQALRLFCPRIEAPTVADIALALEVEIRTLIDSGCSDPVWNPLFRHLRASPGEPITTLIHRRLITLTEQIGHLFRRYGEYGGVMLAGWESRTLASLGWQERLWRLLFTGEGAWDFPVRQLSDVQLQSIAGEGEWQLHLFAMSFLCRLHHHFFMQVSDTLPVTFYQLSPTLRYWADIRSDREAHRLLHRGERQGVSVVERDTAELLLEDRNRLLGNMGRLGREAAQLFDDYHMSEEEAYQYPRALLQYLEYKDLADEPDVHMDGSDLKPASLIHCIQGDLLAMRRIEDLGSLDLPLTDDSVQVHRCDSPLREVHALYDGLLALIDRHRQGNDPLTPRDIVVMAPDIADYAPYLRVVFGSEESQLDISIVDLPVRGQSRLITAFVGLLELSAGRWEASLVLELLSCDHLQNRFDFPAGTVVLVRRWVEEQGIRWGYDASHRRRILGSDRVSNPGHATWITGLTRLLEGEVSGDPTRGLGTDAETLGAVLAILKSLKEDLLPLECGRPLTVDQWSDYLQCLLDAYFCVDSEDSSEEMAASMLRRVIQRLRRGERPARPNLDEALFSFATIRRHLMSALDAETSAFHDSHIQAVRCCSMLPMRAIPARVIWLLGMGESDYPRQDLMQSLDQLRGSSDCDYYPSRVDYDRYLFLETMLSTRDYLRCSYSAAMSDGVDQGPSLVLQELLDYSDTGYSLGGNTPSDILLVKHPYRQHAPQYFSDESSLKGYSKRSYMLTRQSLGPLREPYSLITRWCDPSCAFDPGENSKIIDLSLLNGMARHPIRSYLQRTLGIYLRETEHWECDDSETFSLSPLEHGLLRKQAFHQPVEEVIAQADQCGLLPAGAFREVAVQRLIHDVEVWKGILRKLGIDGACLYDIELRRDCMGPNWVNEHHLQLPAIKVEANDCHYTIVGALPDCINRGMLVHAKGDSADVARLWPQALILGLLDLTGQSGGDIFLTKSGNIFPVCIETPGKELVKWLGYYERALTGPSPLLPEWTAPIIAGDAAALEKVMAGANSRWAQIKDPVLDWLFLGEGGPDAEKIVSEWHDAANNLLGAPFQWWLGKK
ncbi:Uncharacterized protein SCG7086_AX_00070 [Chlamydiales bacterium SCGC AG-110-P3]|nr:Uncharacterized protein SCG7086_AX_00070 [Chlamydiales bacterium SCGC AG-110-P3]